MRHAGYCVVLTPAHSLLPNVLAVLEHDARTQAELACAEFGVAVAWDDLAALGYRVCHVELWEVTP
jgi:hypothetical protein